jgi:hypothetical protein
MLAHPFDGKENDRLADAAGRLLGEMIDQQRRKVTAMARRLHPGATPEDVLNPQDVPVLSQDPAFNYEEGMLAGLLAAQVALRARLFRNRR